MLMVLFGILASSSSSLFPAGECWMWLLILLHSASSPVVKHLNLVSSWLTARISQSGLTTAWYWPCTGMGSGTHLNI